MAALNTDTFRKSAPLFSTTLNGAISNASTSIVLQSIAGLPTDTGISLVIDPVTATQTNAALQETVVGVISAGTVSLINALRGVEGTAQSHASGAAVYAYLTGTDWNALMAAILNDHVQGGYHNNLHDTNGNLWLSQLAAASAVNYAQLGNAATGANPTLAAIGSDTNIGLQIQGKGTGKAFLDSYSEIAFDFVQSGCVWTADAPGSTLNASMTAGVIYQNGQRLVIPAVTAHAFAASKDTYIDVLNTNGVGSIVYTAVANNAASPALAANSVRIGIIVTGASNIANSGSVNQGQETMVLPIVSSVALSVTDTLGNLICPRDPNRKVLGYKQIIANITTTSTSGVQATGLSCPVVVPTGRKVKITVYCGQAGLSAQGFLTLSCMDGSTQLNYALIEEVSGLGNSVGQAVAVTTPVVASKTYNLYWNVNTGTGTLTASSTIPAYILVELV